MLTHLLILANSAWVLRPISCFLLLTALFSSVDWSVLSTSLEWLDSVSFSGLPSLVLFRSRGGSREQVLQNRQRNPLTGTHTYRNECHPSCHNYYYGLEIRKNKNKNKSINHWSAVFFKYNFPEKIRKNIQKLIPLNNIRNYIKDNIIYDKKKIIHKPIYCYADVLF